MNNSMQPGLEPALDDIFDEPIVRALMDRDQIDRQSLTNLLLQAEHRANCDVVRTE